MPEVVKKNWVQWIVSFALIIITVFLADWLKGGRDYDSNIIKQIDSKASYEYVDKQDESLAKQITQQGENQAKITEQQDKRYESIDRKLEILLIRTK